MNKPKSHIAVTGTKGKSTTLRIIQHAFLINEISVWGSYGLDGRYHNGTVNEKRSDCVDYLKILEKSEILLSEATSFILTLNNVYQEESIDVAIFTSFDNTEHMELHHTGKKYLQDKMNIFNFLKKNGVAIINKDIKEFDQITSKIKQKIISYGLDKSSDYVVGDIEQSIFGTTFSITNKNTKHLIKTKLISEANMLNMTAGIIAVVETQQLTIDEVIASMSSFPGVKGRCNFFRIPDCNNEVVIDYAHTAGSLEEILKTLKIVSDKKLVCIFGCGGNKSIEKRSPMGLIAEKYADKIIITNDNPRKESPHKIANDILKDIKNRDKFEIILDRSLAIKSTLHNNHNCIILIAGKGAEHSISFSEFEFPYNDHNTVLTYAISNQYAMMKAAQYVD